MPIATPILLFLANPAEGEAPSESSPEARAELSQAIGAVLRGEGEPAIEMLETVSEAELSSRDRALRSCSLARIKGTPASPQEDLDPFVVRLLTAFRDYWQRALTDKDNRSQLERKLHADLSLLTDQPSLTDPIATETAIFARLEDLGLHAQMGRTGVLRDLMIWSSETQSVEQVPLPEGSHATTVTYLDQFQSRGWSSYFTCNRTGTGGWTTSDGLFAIVPAYASLSDENFQVNFLAHESQHFADFERFRELPQWRLEYRAKLVELAYAEKTRERILHRFESNQSDNIEDSHSYANRLVLENIEERLELNAEQNVSDILPERLRATAKALLHADSEELKAIM